MLRQVQSAGEARALDGRGQSLGDGRLHLERPARARRGRGVAGDLPGGVPAGHGGARRGARRHRRQPSRALGRRAGAARTSTPSSSCSRAMRRSASAAQAEHAKLVARCPGVEVLSTLDLEATPPFDARARPFRLSRPAVAAGDRRHGRGADARLGRAAEAGRVHPRLSRTRTAPPANQPQPEILSRNGSYMAYRRLEEHVGTFRDFLREHGKTPEEQELIAAKLMGRWRSGAPLVLAPEKDDPGARRRPAAQQRLQLQASRTRTATRCRSARTSAA